jgi:hypothetical protein
MKRRAWRHSDEETARTLEESALYSLCCEIAEALGGERAADPVTATRPNVAAREPSTRDPRE